jgi:hypothetical protein
MTPYKPAKKPGRPVLPVLGFGTIILALVALLQFEEPRLAVLDRLDQLAGGRAKRTVYVETDPIAGGSGLIDADSVSVRLRIGLADRSRIKQFQQVAPAFYGELLREFDRQPINADPTTGRVDLFGIESRARGVLEALLGVEAVRYVRVTEVRRRPL